MNRRLSASIGAALTVPALALAIGVGPGAAAPRAAASATQNLVGTFKLKPGAFASGNATGTYFRMILADGTSYFTNPDSSASDKTYTLGTPGSQGGLVTGRYQAPAGASFDAKGNALSAKIVRPQSFSGIDFSVATPAVDPQTKNKVPAPVIRVTGRKLSGQMQAFCAEWNKQYFNQGAPKPNGSGALATGSYNPKTRHFVLTWTSKIKGGPFNGFSGFWHLEGTFKPR